MLIILLIISLLPLSLSIYGFYDKNLKKLFFAVYLFGLIQVLSGYVTKRKGGGFYLHKKNKAIILKPKINSFKGDNAILKALSVNTLIINAICGAEGLQALFSLYAIKNALGNVITSVNGNKLTVNYGFNLFITLKNEFSLGVKTVIKTCGLRILLAVIAKAIKKGNKN